MQAIVKISDSIYSIEDSMVRSFLIIGSQRALLLDTGVDRSPYLEIIPTLTEKPVILVNTHADGDHISQNNLFSEGYASPQEIETLNKKTQSENVNYYPIYENDVFDLGGILLEVIEIPGHTPGSIGLLNRETGDFFSGDMVSYAPIYMFGEGRNLHQFLESQYKILNEKDIRVLFPCHGACPITEWKKVVSDLILLTQSILDTTSQYQMVQKTAGHHEIQLKQHFLNDVSIYTT